MCIKRYHTARGIPKARAVKVEKDTRKSIVVNGRWRAKRGNWGNYYDTFEEAKDAMVSRARSNVKGCTMRLKEAEDFLHKIQSVTTVSSKGDF